MRYFEISSATRIPVSSEEQKILDLAGEGVLEQDDMDERQKELARLMVSRGLLNRDNDGGLTANSLSKIERY